MSILDDFDTSKFKLSGLCKRNHEYKNTGKTLRKLCGECPLCRKISGQERKAKDPQKFAEDARKSALKCYYKNRDKNLARMLEWRENNRAYHRASVRKWYEKNQEYALEYARGRRSQEHIKERNKALGKAYRAANPEKVKHNDERRKKRIAQASDKTVTPQFVAEQFELAKKCPYCGCRLDDNNKSIDHMVPLVGGGLHSRFNIVVCCLKCNLRKQAKSFDDWLTQLEEPYKTKCLKLYIKRYGTHPSQLVLPIKFN